MADFDYIQALGGPANLGGVSDTVQNALFNSQKLQVNQAQIDQQQRMDAARQAAAQLMSNPKVDDATFEQLLHPIAQADPNTAYQMRRTRDMQRTLGVVMANPTPQNIGRFGMLYPEQLEPIKKGWDVLDSAQREAVLKTNADVYALLMKGDTAGAKQVLQSHEAADKAAGVDTSAYAALHDLLDSNPDGAKALAGMSLSTAMGHDKFADSFKALGGETRADELQPAAVQEATAKAATATTEAQYAPQKTESELATAAAQRQRMASQNVTDLMDARTKRGQLELDGDKLAAETEIKLKTLEQNGTKIDPHSTELMNQSATEAVAANQLADKETDLAARIRQAGMAAGPRATIAETAKKLGFQNEITQLRAEWVQLKNTQALSNRKNMPGALSDADRNFLLQGFPPDNASPEYLAHFLETMAKVQRATGQQADAKASWISANGNLGTAKSDLNIGGVMVRAGTSFAQFSTGATQAGSQGQPGGGLQAIIQKYGRKR